MDHPNEKNYTEGWKDYDFDPESWFSPWNYTTVESSNLILSEFTCSLQSIGLHPPSLQWSKRKRRWKNYELCLIKTGLMVTLVLFLWSLFFTRTLTGCFLLYSWLPKYRRLAIFTQKLKSSELSTAVYLWMDGTSLELLCDLASFVCVFIMVSKLRSR